MALGGEDRRFDTTDGASDGADAGTGDTKRSLEDAKTEEGDEKDGEEISEVDGLIQFTYSAHSSVETDMFPNAITNQKVYVDPNGKYIEATFEF